MTHALNVAALRLHPLDNLPASGYIRQGDLLPRDPVTPEQAEANRLAKKRLRRVREARPGLVPFSSATLWRKVGDGTFPKPVKLSERVTAWRVEDVRRWLDEKAAAA